MPLVPERLYIIGVPAKQKAPAFRPTLLVTCWLQYVAAKSQVGPYFLMKPANLLLKRETRPPRSISWAL
ncbi:hypothetical protein, partial [Halomonas sp. ND22Bw]|uniref:hypothetical protein n=1 Tax=Halomonas sp. ND22Bw TaxID=2054178 RepID=UPI001C636B6A